MNPFSRYFLLTFSTVLWSACLFAQSPPLGSTINFILFSSSGAVSNAGNTVLTGDVGTNSGTPTGFDTSLVNGTVHLSPNAATAQCATDLGLLFAYLDSLPHDSQLSNPATFGNSMVLTARVYYLNAATVMTDTLFLDAQNNSTAVFVIKVNGALTTSKHAHVVLRNGAQAKNVYWKIEGAATIMDSSYFKGTLVCHTGAISIKNGTHLDGRALTTSGAVDVTSNMSNIPLPVTLLQFSASASNGQVYLSWVTATENNNHFFSVQNSDDGMLFNDIAIINGAGNSLEPVYYSTVDYSPLNGLSYYRLKQTDFNGSFKYLKTIPVQIRTSNFASISLFPNPASNNVTTLIVEGEKGHSVLVELTDITGKIHYSANSLIESDKHTLTIPLNKLKTKGTYLVCVSGNTNRYFKRLIVQ
jgi:hypothetical protein